MSKFVSSLNADLGHLSSSNTQEIVVGAFEALEHKLKKESVVESVCSVGARWDFRHHQATTVRIEYRTSLATSTLLWL